MSHLTIFLIVLTLGSVLAYINGKRVAKEGYSFSKTFIFTLIACVGLFFFIVKLISN